MTGNPIEEYISDLMRELWVAYNEARGNGSPEALAQAAALKWLDARLEVIRQTNGRTK